MLPPFDDMRPLVWPLTDQLYTSGDTPDTETITFPTLQDWPTLDPDERIRIVLDVSFNEYLALGSSIDVGRDIAYSNGSVYIWWLWLRSLVSMNICEDVATCIESNSDVANALATLITSNQTILDAINNANQITNQYGGGADWSNPLPSSILTGNAIPNDALCTEANKYAMSLAIVRALDTLTTDFLEIIEVATNPQEIAAAEVAHIPIFGGAAAAALDFAAWMQDNIQETYAAAYNSSTEQDYACAVYCAFSDCELSYNDILQAYYSQGSFSPPPTNDFLAMIDWMVTNVIPSVDNVIVGSMHAMILLCLQWGSSWVGSAGFTSIDIAIEDAKDEEVSVPPGCECSEITYPDLVPTRCEDSLELGTITQVDFQTWDIQSEVFGSGSYIFFQDSLGRAMNVASIITLSDPIVVQTSDYQPSAACSRTGTTFGGIIAAPTVYGVTMTRNVDNTNLVTVRVVFNPNP